MPGPTHSIRGGASRFALTLTACIVALIVVGAMTVRYITVDLPAEVLRRSTAHATEVAREIASEVATSFQIRPKVTVGNKTIVEQETEVARFVVLERTVSQRHRFTHSWLQSTKTFEVEGTFVVRAGIDFSRPFEIRIDETGSDLHVQLPEAEIFGAELQDVDILRDENGLWNKLTAEDRERALRELRTRVLEEAEETGLATRAREVAEENLRKLLETPQRTVTIESARLP